MSAQFDRLVRVCAASVSLLALSACGVGDDYARPDIAVPAAYTDPGDGQTDAVGADWWRTFGSAPLDAYMAAAMRGNFDLAAAIARVRQAEAQMTVAGASLFPTVDLNAGVDRQHTPTSASSSRSGSASSGKAIQTTTYSTSLSASYELDFWGKNRYGAESAEASALASRTDSQTVKLTITSSVADTYFAALGYRDRLAVARRNLDNAREVLAAIRDRVRLGTATDLDQAQQENVVATDEAAIPPLEQNLAQNLNALALLVGQAPEQLALGEGVLEAVKVPSVASGLPATLLERRPDVRNAEYQLIAANADIGAARAALFPSVSLTAQYGYESTALSSLLNPSSALWSIGSSLAQPIFHGGALTGALDVKKGRYEELVADYRKAVISALSDVENALVANRKSAEQEQAQRIVVATARRAYDISVDQLRAGTTDIVTLLNTQRSLFSAEDGLVQARLAHLQAVVSLYKALGGGWSGEPVAASATEG